MNGRRNVCVMMDRCASATVYTQSTGSVYAESFLLYIHERVRVRVHVTRC